MLTFLKKSVNYPCEFLTIRNIAEPKDLNQFASGLTSVLANLRKDLTETAGGSLITAEQKEETFFERLKKAARDRWFVADK